MQKEVVLALIRHYPIICLEGPRKSTETPNQDNRFLDRD
jgi:hypothetical protein